MLTNSLRRSALQMRAPTQKYFLGGARNNSGIPNTLYNSVWRKSNIMYITYIVAGCVILEGVYGSVTNFVWDTYNSGKLYKQIDWSKFKSEDEDDEEEE
mmetsp:Transcript_120612/g.341048  ORF Transcript_120612/g.341048 Transcript_120612/m.341048 type:complete len:99 (+) Transcript_120612:19-315(+)